VIEHEIACVLYCFPCGKTSKADLDPGLDRLAEIFVLANLYGVVGENSGHAFDVIVESALGLAGKVLRNEKYSSSRGYIASCGDQEQRDDHESLALVQK
jgi:hypothetical protein